MFNLKIIIGFAAFALIITLLTGLFGGVPFGVLLLRVLIGSAVFAGLGAATSWVLHRHLPEVFTIQVGSSGKTAEEETLGESIDIVLPEENPYQAEEPRDDEETATGEEATGEEADTAESVDDDLDRFADLKSVPIIEGLQDDSSSSGGQRSRNEAVESLGVERDPETAAKAIKTWLNKDKEG